MTSSSSAMPLTTATHQRPRVPRSTYVGLAGSVLVWAANWAMTKSVLHDISTVSFVAYRFLCAAPFMALLTLPMGQALVPRRGERLPLALIGIVQIAGSQFFSTVGLQYVAAGRTVVLLYTMQLWTLPLGWLINRERVSLPALAGGAIGFSGLFLFLNPQAINWSDSPGSARQLPLSQCRIIVGARGLPLSPAQVADIVLDANFLAGAVDRHRPRAPAAGAATRHPLDRTRHWHDRLQRHRLHRAGLVVVGQGSGGDAGRARRTNRHPGSGACRHHRRPLGRRAVDARHRRKRGSYLSGNRARAARPPVFARSSAHFA